MPSATQFMKEEYPDSKSDLFAGFIKRCTNLAGPRGTVAMITMQSWMFLSSYEKLRAALLAKQRITSMLHLGAHAFDSIGGEVVSSTAFVLENVPPEARGPALKRTGTFVRLINGTSEADKAAALRTALEVRTKESGFHLASDADFAAIPGSPIVYWLSEKMLGVWPAGVPLSTISEPRQGLITGDGESFVRLWWESSCSQTSFVAESRLAAKVSRARWFPYNKGGEYRKWYGNHEYLVNWEDDGRAVRTLGTESGGRARSRPQNVDYYFKPTVSWSNVSSGSPAFRIFPAGFIAAGSTGDGVYPNDEDTSMSLLGILNSSVAEAILAATSPTLTFNVGTIAALPVVQTDDNRTVAWSTRRLVAQSQDDWNSIETSWDFSANPLVDLAKG